MRVAPKRSAYAAAKKPMPPATNEKWTVSSGTAVCHGRGVAPAWGAAPATGAKSVSSRGNANPTPGGPSSSSSSSHSSRGRDAGGAQSPLTAFEPPAPASASKTRLNASAKPFTSFRSTDTLFSDNGGMTASYRSYIPPRVVSSSTLMDLNEATSNSCSSSTTNLVAANRGVSGSSSRSARSRLSDSDEDALAHKAYAEARGMAMSPSNAELFSLLTSDPVADLECHRGAYAPPPPPPFSDAVRAPLPRQPPSYAESIRNGALEEVVYGVEMTAPPSYPSRYRLDPYSPEGIVFEN